MYNLSAASLTPIDDLCVCVCRSIQKLEEMNVGMDNVGEGGVQSVSQQCNGTPGPNSSTQTQETGPLRDKPGGVSSTPLMAGSQGMPSFDESPVQNTQR